MIIFISEGQLGNQLFQYAFLKTLASGSEKLMVFAFDSLSEVFDAGHLYSFSKKGYLRNKLIYRFIRPFLETLSKIKIISSISSNRRHFNNDYFIEDGSFTRLEGLFKRITFVKLGFFQGETNFDKKAIKGLRVKKYFTEQAKQFLSKVPVNSYLVFVHIRRGDYLNFKVLGKKTLLPKSYYDKQIQWFLKNRDNPFFIFLSDDPDYIESEFSHIKQKLISENNHYGVDFSIMTLCQGAILSPSSFSWWGSYFMKERDMVFAPEHWLGFESKIEYPCNVTPSYSRTVKVC